MWNGGRIDLLGVSSGTSLASPQISLFRVSKQTLDKEILGRILAKWGFERISNLNLALELEESEVNCL